MNNEGYHPGNMCNHYPGHIRHSVVCTLCTTFCTLNCMHGHRMAWKLLSNVCESNVVLKFCISNEVCRKRSTLKKYLNWFGHFSHTHTQFSIHSQLVHARGIIKFSESIVYRVNWCNLNKRFPISATFCMKVCSQYSKRAIGSTEMYILMRCMSI